MALADSSATEENAALVLDAATAAAPIVPPKPLPDYDFGSFKLPYNHENVPLGELLGKATVVCNIKLDDPQTVMQYPALREIYEKYVDQGLSVLVFPTEQGYFEPDDDETVRAKSKEYFSFGSYPRAVVFDKVDVLGPSAHPLYAALTSARPTPNGYSRITLNYEKFLLDAAGKPVRRYPRKFSAYDMEADISALLKGEALPEESPAFQKAWREAKREAVKSEYAFRYNYNYYTAPDSMYKYNPSKDRIG
jgi:glutathione peroxidase